MDWSVWIRRLLGVRAWDAGTGESVHQLHAVELESRVFMSASPLGDVVPEVEHATGDSAGTPVWGNSVSGDQPEIYGLGADLVWDPNGSSGQRIMLSDDVGTNSASNEGDGLWWNKPSTFEERLNHQIELIESQIVEEVISPSESGAVGSDAGSNIVKPIVGTDNRDRLPEYVERPMFDTADFRGESVDVIDRDLVFISGDVVDHQTLVEQWEASGGEGRDFTFVIIGRQDDGISIISDYLSTSNDLFSAVHLVGHGFAGGLRVGSTMLNSANLDSYSSELALWQDYLAADADLLL